MATRTGSAAVAYALAQHLHPSRDWTGLCLRFTRDCLGVPARYPSAAVAWSYIAGSDRHPGGTPPPGVPVLWLGGSHGYGHAALSAGGGYIWTTDLIRRGKVDKAPLALVHRRWGLPYAGWAATINGIRVWAPTVVPPTVPVVHLANVVAAFHADPHAAQGHGLHPADVRPVEAALIAEGLLDDRWGRDGAAGSKTVKAYARWQVRCGRTGTAADGIPGASSLGRLAVAHGLFRVAA